MEINKMYGLLQKAFLNLAEKLKQPGAKSKVLALNVLLMVGLYVGISISKEHTWYTKHYQHIHAHVEEFQLKGWQLPFSTRTARSELEQLLLRLAPRPQREVMISINNSNLRHGELQMWVDCVKRLPIQNWLVVALDEKLRDYCVKNSINHYFRPTVVPDSQRKASASHAAGALKYQIIQEFLELGWSVLLSDVDVVTIQNPFDHLYRDSDVEAMSDGFDEHSAYGANYGVIDESMGWSRYAQGTQHMALNSGLFYIRANDLTINLMKRINLRLMKAQLWDQSVFNEEIFFLTHGRYESAKVSVRVMDIMMYMNSKVLFMEVRHMPRSSQPAPVMVHMNYHPDKAERMRAAMKFFIEGDEDALEPFPGGSAPGS